MQGFPPVSTDRLWGHLEHGTTLLTPTKRLSRELLGLYNQSQIDSGARAWPTPDILPVESWVARTWQQHARFNSASGDNQPSRYRILSAMQSRLLWQKLIQEDIDATQPETAALWNLTATVSVAMDAWHICRQWQIDFDAVQRSWLEDHRRFAGWAIRYQALCEKSGWMDMADIASRLSTLEASSRLALPARIILSDFDSISPQHHAVLEKLQSLGVEVGRHSRRRPEGAARSIRAYDDEADQWLGAAQWARQILLENPSARVAIVCPDLARARHGIEQALDQVICPDRIMQPGSHLSRPYHFSLGIALAKFAVTRSASRLLEILAGSSLTPAVISGLLLDPYIMGAAAEKFSRASLDNWISENMSPKFTLDDLSRVVDDEKWHDILPALSQLLQSAISFRADNRAPVSHTEWSQRFINWLELLGWPGEAALDSETFLVVEGIREIIASLADMDVVEDRSSATGVLSALDKAFAMRPFEAENPGAQIEVMGVIESAGLSFDSIWMGSLDSGSWPPPASPNPLVPRQLQVDAGYHSAASQLAWEHARAQQDRLGHQCQQLVLALHQFDDGVEVPPSTLVGAGPAAQDAPISLAHQLGARELPLARIRDWRGPVFSGSEARGGVTLLEDQAACPFRAFARHRLGARSVTTQEQGLDHSERGQLVHAILERIWQVLGNSTRLAGCASGELEEIVRTAISECSRRFYENSGCQDGFFAAQSQWLVELVIEWLAIERNRSSGFEVVATEKSLDFRIGGLGLTLKLDRVDRLDDGSIALIDYKTGRARSTRDWVGERPRYVQIGLYALAAGNREALPQSTVPGALLVGEVRLGNSRFCGFSLDQDIPFLGDVPGSRKIPALEDSPLVADQGEEISDWPSLESHWHRVLEHLAQSFRQGVATVDPLDDACTFCDLQPLCRINEFLDPASTGDELQ